MQGRDFWWRTKDTSMLIKDASELKDRGSEEEDLCITANPHQVMARHKIDSDKHGLVPPQGIRRVFDFLAG